MSWGKLFSNENYIVGEVANVNDNLIDVFVYPEKFNTVAKGSILVIDSGDVRPVGIVLKKAHEASYSSFTPLRQPRDKIDESYPDLKNYHKFVSRIVYTSTLRNNRIKHYRSIMPLLHDRVYILREPDFLDLFFKPEGSWDFTFLEYYLLEGADHIDVREFFMNHSEYFNSKIEEKEAILNAVIDALRNFDYGSLIEALREIEKVLSD